MGTPKWASSISGVFESIAATVSPATIPRAVRAEASRRDRSRVSAQVYRRLPWMTEVRPG